MSACLCRQTQAVGISPGLLGAGEGGGQILHQALLPCSVHVPAHVLGWKCKPHISYWMMLTQGCLLRVEMKNKPV